MSDTNGERGILRRSLGGAVQGAVVLGFIALVLSAMVRSDLQTAWQRGAFFALIGGLSLGAGRAASRGTLGALIGGLAGALLAGLIADRLGVHFIYNPAGTAPRGMQLEISGPTLDGQSFTTRAWQGKVVLIDFWATWCGPCVAELPNVRAIYERYHADGFEVVGISLDHGRDKLARFVKENNIAWPQIFFPDATGWNNPLARKYGVQSIPATLLLDQDARAAATDLRGVELEEEVARLLEKTTPLTFRSFDRLRLDLTAMPPALTISIFLGCSCGALIGAFAQRRASRSHPNAA